MSLITIEFCAEDRARIDRLTEALERRSCDDCVKGALSWSEQVRACQEAAVQQGLDPLEQKLAETLAKAEAPVAPPPAPDPVPVPEPAPAPAVEVPSLAEFQKALSLRCAESETTKAKVRALLHEYAEAASKVPEDKRAEVLARLAKL